MRYCQACHRCFGDGVEFCLFDNMPTRANDSMPLVIDGKYRLDQLIAHGGMGAVYRATHLQLEREVAIKILRAEFLADSTVCERFNREARAAARLKHPNIVAVYDFGMLPSGGAYLVMELIEGRSLREEMRMHATGHGQMKPERAAAILSQVCAGIEAAHRHRIVHRDLKPDNVMIEPSDEGTERVLVLDFGIAKLKDRENVLQGLTDENTVIGTPNYISPEQCTGQPVDARSDIYSLGVILYEMLTGRVPFVGQNTSAVLLRHLQEPPAPPSRFRPGLNRELEKVVLRALAKNPQHRFQSALQFAEEITGAARTYHGSVDEVEDKTKTRHRVVIAPPTDYSPDTELTGVFTVPKPEPADFPDQLQDQIEEAKVPALMIKQPPRTMLYASMIIISLSMIAGLGYFLTRDSPPQESVLQDQNGIETKTPTQPAKTGAGGVQDSGRLSGAESGSVEKLKMDASLRPTSDVVPVKNDSSSPVNNVVERTQRDVRSIYTEWALAAIRNDWNKHMSYYADRVEYFSYGVLPKSKIEARKRQIFSGLDSYSLRFTDSPQVILKNFGGILEADLVFDRKWVLRKGRKKVPGQARGIITLRRDSHGWRIVSERQIKK